MASKISRREFLKLSSLSLGALAFRLGDVPSYWPPEWEDFTGPMKARVTTSWIYLYQKPDFNSPRIGTLRRDTLLPLGEEVESPHGPAHNPRWYRLANSFVHSAYLQRVEKARLNAPLRSVPEGGQLAEVTVPFTQTERKTRAFGWKKVYRLYYGSVHWMTGLVEGPDGEPWYQLTDDLLKVDYCAPAAHFRPIQPEEIAPISPDVPPEQKRIEVSIADQTLTAYENDKVVLHTKISSGLPDRRKHFRPGEYPTDTPLGKYFIEVKIPSRHMGDGELTSDPEAYELPGVPWVSFFHPWGVAFHGTYWHDNFGRRMSHGCVNMRNNDAKWLYRWSQPHAGPEDWRLVEHGTLVHVY